MKIKKETLTEVDTGCQVGSPATAVNDRNGHQAQTQRETAPQVRAIS